MKSSPYRTLGGVVALAGSLTCSSVAMQRPALPVITKGNERFIQFRQLARFYHLDYQKSYQGDHLLLKSKWSRFKFKQDSRKVWCNGVLVWLHHPVIQHRGRWALNTTDYRSLLDPLLRSERYLKSCGSKRVVIDPGHGGKDSGAKGGKGSLEKMLALDVSRKLRDRLRAAGVEVVLTREDDRYLSLQARCDVARAAKGDLLVSLHFNQAGNRKAEGIETYVATAAGYLSTTGWGSGTPPPKTIFPGNRYDAANGYLAYQVHKRLLDQVKGTDRGVKKARFVVLKNAPCPSVLVECGFLSHPGEEKKALSPDHRDRLAQGIARGLLDYLAAVKRAQLAAPAP